MNSYTIKQLPEDFHVTEVLSLPHSSISGKISIYLLEKVGYRTLDVVAGLEKILNLSASEKIGFVGLKDEDGVTFQHISIPGLLSKIEIDAIMQQFNQTEGSYIKLTPLLNTNEHLKVGRLHGNCFRIKVRNLSKHLVREIARIKEHSLLLINYYGPQRFGLPGQIKNTSKIGQALCEGDFSQALHELCLQTSEESQRAKAYMARPEEYFEMLDNRLVAFYQSSYFSSLWNQEIISSMEQQKISSRDCIIDGVSYSFLPDINSIAEVLSANLLLKNKRATLHDGVLAYEEYLRPPVISTKIIVEESVVDKCYNNNFCTLSFFLPSGSYASMIIPQFLIFLETLIFQQKSVLEIC